MCYPLNEQVILRHNKLGKGTGFGTGEDGDPAYTLQANHPHMIAAFMGGQGAKARSIAYYDDGTTPTIKSVMSGSNTVPDVVYGIEGNVIDRNSSQNGSGVCVDVSPSMNTQDRHGIAYAADYRNLELNEELSGTLQAKNQGGHSLNYINPVVYSARGEQ